RFHARVTHVWYFPDELQRPCCALESPLGSASSARPEADSAPQFVSTPVLANACIGLSNKPQLFSNWMFMRCSARRLGSDAQSLARQLSMHAAANCSPTT